MADAEAKKAKMRDARIKAAKAAKKLPTAILLQRKVECDAKALKIVERLIETQVDESWMLQNLSLIHRSHLEDVIEERAIQKLCGYALCDGTLTKTVNNKYKISTLRNKVYDVQKTKNFCSFWCYSAAEYLLEQMLTSPLWLRAEEDIPEFLAFDKPKDKMKNPPGVEVNIVGLDLPSESDEPQEIRKKDELNGEIKKPVSDEKSSAGISEKSTDIISELKIVEKSVESLMKSSEKSNLDQKTSDVSEKILLGPKLSEKSVSELNTDEETECEDSNESQKANSESIILQKPIKSLTRLSEESLDLNKRVPHLKNFETTECTVKPEDPVTKPESEDQSVNSEPVLAKVKAKRSQSEFSKNSERLKKSKQRPPVSIASLTAKVEQSFTEWITKYTIDLLHGDDSTKQRLLETLTLQDKYGELCKKLNLIQIEESKEDRVSAIQSTVLQPAPDFSVLKGEAESLEVKVRAFYQGSTVIEPPATDEKNPETTEKLVPLTPAHAPMALRRRIFLDKLNKVLPDLLGTLSGPDQYHARYTPEKTAKVKALVSTFRLSATNIVFKSAEWTLVAFLIIKTLSIMDVNTKNLLATKQASMYTSMILMSYQLDSSYLDRLVASLTMRDRENNCDQL